MVDNKQMYVGNTKVTPARFRLMYQKALSEALQNRFGSLLVKHQAAVNRNDYEEAEQLETKILGAAEDFLNVERGYTVWEELPTMFTK